MTRERDRIQENANKYIVKNCPAIFYSGIIDEAKCWQNGNNLMRVVKIVPTALQSK